MLLPLIVLLLSLFTPGHSEPDNPPRLILSFYYPWYATPTGVGGISHGKRFIHWEGVDPAAKTIASSTNYPLGGAYDSQDPAVLKRHCELAKDAGVDAFIISWWGATSYEDGAVKPLLDECARHNLKASIYYEQLAKPGTPESVTAELEDLLKRFADHPAFLRIKRDEKERPVLFIYSRALQQLGLNKWKQVTQSLAKLPTPPLLIADDFGAESIRIFDGAHTYGPAGDVAAAFKKGESAEAWAKRAMPYWAQTPRKAGKISCATVFPGYDDTKVRKPGLKVERDDGKFYELLWREAVAAQPDWILITSFNEWHEGSEIEPSEELGDKYLKLTARWARQFKAPQPTSTPTK